MSDTNVIVIEGRLTRNATLSFIQSGTPVCNFSIANNQSYKKDNEWIQKTTFFDCELWGNFGQAMTAYLTTGKKITVTGSLYIQKWDKDGISHQRSIIRVSEISLPPSKKTEDPHTAQTEPQEQQSTQSQNKFEGSSEEVPF